MTTLYPPYNIASPDKVLNQLEPLEFTAGDSLAWERNFQDYPASAGWTLRYTLVGSGGKFTFNSVGADGDSIKIAVASAVTLTWPPGLYEWQAKVISADSLTQVTVLSGAFKVKQSFDALGTGADMRSHARIVLDAIEAVIENRATKDQYEYSISGRMLRLTPLPDLVKFRQIYKAEVARENAANAIKVGLGSRNKITVRFNS